MKLARYHAGGRVAIEEAPEPVFPPGGLIVQTEACGLCSGELMTWYLDRKAPHVLGHEVAGIVLESEDSRFPVGARVFPHHHGPCLKCSLCLRGAFVYCPQWKRTKLDPGGMAERFAVSAENLTDTIAVGEMPARTAALIEPLACVMKGISRSGVSGGNVAVIGAGALGLMHAFALKRFDPVVIELQADRIERATKLGFRTRTPGELEASAIETVFVCPGSSAAVAEAFRILAPDGTIVFFAPMPPDQPYPFSQESAYFKDAKLIHSYSCGPTDTQAAFEALQNGIFKAEEIVSDFVTLDDLPRAYEGMKSGELFKVMVEFGK